MIRAAVILAAMAGSGGLLFAQAAPPAPPALAFEAASVKRNPNPEAPLASPRFQGVTFTAANVGVETLITAAYGIQSRELIDAPAWISLSRFGERYDVVAKAPEGSSRQDMQAMLRHLLETRFALRLRRETRERPVYVLTTVDEGSALGPNLRRAVKDCLPRTACEGRVGRRRRQRHGSPMVLHSASDRRRTRSTRDRSHRFIGRVRFRTDLQTAGTVDEPGRSCGRHLHRRPPATRVEARKRTRTF